MKNKWCDSPQYWHNGYDNHEAIPKPYNQIDFIIDNIQWHNAECIVYLNRARWTKFIEIAFGNLGEYVSQIIVKFQASFKQFWPQRNELIIEKNVGYIDLHGKIDYIQHFTQNHTNCKRFINLHMFEAVEILFDQSDAFRNFVCASQITSLIDTHISCRVIVFSQRDFL